MVTFVTHTHKRAFSPGPNVVYTLLKDIWLVKFSLQKLVCLLPYKMTNVTMLAAKIQEWKTVKYERTVPLFFIPEAKKHRNPSIHFHFFSTFFWNNTQEKSIKHTA